MVTPGKFSLYRRGEVWWIDLRTPDGRRRFSSGCTDHGEAHRRALALIQEQPQGGPPSTLKAILDDLWQSKWSKTKSAVQLRYVVPAVQRDIGSHKLQDITYDVLRRYCEELQAGGRSPATANRRMSVVSAGLREAWRRGLLTALPSVPHHREAAPRDRYLTPEEEQTALAYLSKMTTDDTAERRPEWVYLRELFVVLIDTGCRLSEALGATVGNVVGDTLRLTHGSTKSGRGRSVPLTPRAAEALGRLLQHPLHGTASVDWCGHRWGKVRKTCTLGDVNLHVLRHTCASRLVQGGVDLYTVSAWLGHSSVKVTERYAHLRPDALHAAMQALLPKSRG